MVGFKDFNWNSGLFLSLYHVLFVVLTPLYLVFYGLPSPGLLLVTLSMIIAIGFGVTAGYHRLYSHRAYKVNKVVEGILLFFGTLAAENSVLKWSHVHRIHHQFVDTEKDPYNIKQGFWYAHILWILEKSEPIDPKVVPDLLKNKLVMFQDKYYTSLVFGSNILILLGLGLVFKDFFGAFVFAILTRIFVTHHTTFFINSIAHSWGKQPYSKDSTAVDNWFFALLTFGEGYHNYHHAFATDYRNGVKWWQYDPAKWFIWSLSKVGLAYDLHRVGTYAVKRRILREDARYYHALLKQKMSAQKEHLQERVHDLSMQLHTNISQLQEHSAQRKLARAEKRKEYKQKISLLKKQFKRDWKQWTLLSKQITSLV